MLTLAFSSNAFKKTTLAQAASDIAAAGFVGIEVMADVPHAYPPKFGQAQREELRELLISLNLKVSNVNAFTLFADGDTYHPTFIEVDPLARQRRIEHTLAAVRLAADVGAATVSVQPGGPLIGTGLSRAQAGELFAQSLRDILPLAGDLQVALAIEPEPGLFLQTSGEYLAFKQQFFAGDQRLKMNCDLGHLFCVGEDPVEVLQAAAGEIAHIHVEDIGANHVHQHLPLGRGAMDLPAILRHISTSPYAGWTTVELYPYETTAGEVARAAMHYIRGLGIV
jgi:sugar phosphate isomerase/epimerase